MQVGGILAQEVYATVHVGVVMQVAVGDLLNHTEGFLRRGTVVEIDEWLVIDKAVENGEILADCLNVEHGTCNIKNIN